MNKKANIENPANENPKPIKSSIIGTMIDPSLGKEDNRKEVEVEERKKEKTEKVKLIHRTYALEESQIKAIGYLKVNTGKGYSEIVREAVAMYLKDLENKSK